MKKRLAAVAAITVGLFQAISLVGALPAQAAAPSVGSDNCFTNAGKTELYVYGDDSNPAVWTVSYDSSNEHIETAGSWALLEVGDVVQFTNGGNGVSADTDYYVSDKSGNDGWIKLAGVNFTSDGGDEITTTSSAGGDAYLQYDADMAEFYCAVDNQEWTIDGSDITNIVVKAEGDFTMNLEDLGTAEAAAEWPSLGSFDVGTHLFYVDGSGVTSGVDDIDATFTDDTFSVDGVEGQFTYVTSFGFDGGSGNDTLDASDTALKVTATGGAGDDVLTAGDGKDDLTGDAGKDKLFGNANNDNLDCTGAGAGQCWGGEGNDIIEAGTADVVAPGDGNDRITNAGALYYGDSSAGITVDLTDAAGKVTSSAGNDLYSGTVLSFIGSSKDDSFTADDATDTADSFTGGGGDDTLVGYAGDDALVGGGGNDTIYGGAGDDAISGKGGDDTMYGGKGADVIKGGAGDDVMYGLDGADTLKGAKGSDQAWGGQGADICVAEVKDHCELGKL